MPNDPDARLIRKWASATGALVATPESEGLTRTTGWPVSYATPGGDNPQMEIFNQVWREQSWRGSGNLR